jgi:transcriptional regulator with XRE-family HTH domain
MSAVSSENREKAFDNLGNFLLSARLERGLSQQELGERCGLHQSYVSLLERGRRVPTIGQLTRLAAVLERPLQWFINGTNHPGNGLSEMGVELFRLGVVDLVIAPIVPGAFRPPEQVVTLVVCGDYPDPRLVETVPALLAWNKWNPRLLDAYGRSYDPRAVYRLAWLADVTLTIERIQGFPGECVASLSLGEFIRGVETPGHVDDLGRPAGDETLPPVSKRWCINYSAELETFRRRAESLLELKRLAVKGATSA